MRTLAGAAIGLLAGWLVFLALGPRQPLPHTIASKPDSLTFSFALARDILHEYYPRHNLEFYRKRIQETEKVSPEDWAALDDRAASLDRLHLDDQAVEVMRGKLARQMALGVPERERYSTLANLGTFLVHGSFGRAQQGDARARASIEEGLECLREAVRINPDAHFGRERWQIVCIESMLEILDRPERLLEYDLIGNRLTALPPPVERPAVLEPLSWVRRPGQSPRSFVPRVGSEPGWKGAASMPEPVPFDEPSLGILGMWWLGGGPNPHFGLALGGTFERVGALPLAWVAYERALQLEERFWPDPAIRQALASHCRSRQQALEAALGPTRAARLRTDFERRHAEGLQFQKAWGDRKDFPSITAIPDPLDSQPDALAEALLMGAFAVLGAGLASRLPREAGK